MIAHARGACDRASLVRVSRDNHVTLSAYRDITHVMMRLDCDITHVTQAMDLAMRAPPKL